MGKRNGTRHQNWALAVGAGSGVLRTAPHAEEDLEMLAGCDNATVPTEVPMSDARLDAVVTPA
jgi:hypothetical protein